ncbi:MAG: hypothetical protein LBB18_01030 [Puniceicoccales bacterium]|jgi:hypothetical protein|nr:hypothetical protein [Puniceicoccales bacterium]
MDNSGGFDIAKLPVVVTATNANGRVDLMIGDVPAYIWNPNPAVLHSEGIVYLNTVDFSKGVWPDLISVTSGGVKHYGFTNDMRIVNLARLMDRTPAAEIPLGELIQEPAAVAPKVKSKK